MKLTYIALSACLAFSLSSCSDWFDVLPRTQMYEGDLYAKEYGFQQQVTGLYINMSSPSLYGREATFGLMDVLTGMYDIPNVANNTYKYALQYNYEQSSTKGAITSLWSTGYNVIANANEMLRNAGIVQDVAKEETQNAKLSDKFNSEQTRDILCGEALAVRAYVHFDLLRMFGQTPKENPDKPSIPYVTTLKKEVTPQSTCKEVVEKVETDLLQAERLLKTTDPVVKGNPQPSDSYFAHYKRAARMNYYAVCGLLARVYAYAGDWTNARKWAEVVVNSNKYSWNTNASIEKGDKVGTSELVFSLYDSDMKTNDDPYFKITTDGNNSNWLPISGASYKSLYQDGDRRAKLFNTTGGDYLCQKYVVTENDVTDSLSVQHRYPMIRLSEMYYILTEADLDADDLAQANTDLNAVRVGKGLPSKDFTTTDEVRKELDNEYQREFVAEGQLFYYIKRRNAQNLINTQYKVDFVFPLPDNEYTYGNRKPNK